MPLKLLPFITQFYILIQLRVVYWLIFATCRIIVFSSPELKAQVSFSDCLSSVRPSVNCSHFYFLQNHWANFYQTWHISVSLGDRDSSLFKWTATTFSRGDNDIAKIHWRNLKIFSRELQGQYQTNMAQSIFKKF